MLSYPSAMTVSNRALIMLADALRRRRTQLGTRWRRLDPGKQALLVVAHLRKGETYADLAAGFEIGTTTVFRYVQEALEVLTVMTPNLDDAIDIARRKAFVILDGTVRHEALNDRVEVKGLRRRVVAAARLKLRAA